MDTADTKMQCERRRWHGRGTRLGRGHEDAAWNQDTAWHRDTTGTGTRWMQHTGTWQARQHGRHCRRGARGGGTAQGHGMTRGRGTARGCCVGPHAPSPAPPAHRRARSSAPPAPPERETEAGTDRVPPSTLLCLSFPRVTRRVAPMQPRRAAAEGLTPVPVTPHIVTALPPTGVPAATPSRRCPHTPRGVGDGNPDQQGWGRADGRTDREPAAGYGVAGQMDVGRAGARTEGRTST